jgi:tetratricopeptide (TPR) repeat protein
LILLLAVTGFLLACHELFDADVWWHLRGGQWIRSHGRPPGLDPFTFGSQDRVWVDLHWGFQVVLSWAYDHGGVAAIILLTAAVAAAALLTALAVRQPGASIPLAVLCWIPALLLMSSRFNPRPEVFTLLYVAAFLVVLCRVERRPTLAWLLPPLQLLWVNTHGLFILGPILVGFFLAERAGRLLWRRWRGQPPAGEKLPPGQWHIAAASAAVLVACLVNPYGLNGTLLPVQLYPKVTEEGNLYKETIREFTSARETVRTTPDGLGPGNPYIRSLYLLLLVLPCSFLLPAAWRASGAPTAASDARPAGSAGSWLGVFTAAVVLAVVGALSMPVPSTPRWFVTLGDSLPVGFLILAAGGAILLRRRPAATSVAGIGGVFLAAWAAFLRSYLGGAEMAGLPWTLLIAAATGLPLVVLVVALGTSLFRLLMAAAFAYLGLQAIRNAALFGVVGGAILAWNVGEWLLLLRPGAGGSRWRSAGEWAVRLGLGGLLGVWIAALLGGQYYAWTHQQHRIGLRERPLEFPHEAVLFAGGPDLPDRAMVYDLKQAGLFDFHNAPEHRPFLDGRLELAEPETFRTYVTIYQWLHKHDGRWVDALRRLDEPLVFLTHRNHAAAEAALLAHPDWRCVYFDALAAVFVPRSVDLERSYPSVDFARRHFQAAPLVPAEPGAALAEAQALYLLAVALPGPPQQSGPRSWPIFLAALGRAGAAVEEDPHKAEAWAVLGNCHRNWRPRTASRPRFAEGWDPAQTIPWAQTTYCYRRAVELAPQKAVFLALLFASYGARQMADAQLAVADRLLAQGLAHPEQEDQIQQLRQFVDRIQRSREPAADLAGAITNLLRRFQPEAAVRLVEEQESRSAGPLPWAAAELGANACMHLGRPADARRIWQHAASAPSEAMRLCRLASTYWVERDFQAAIELYGQARAADRSEAEACWGLAQLHAQQGRAEEALQACREGLALAAPASLKADLQNLQELLTPRAGRDKNNRPQ